MKFTLSWLRDHLDTDASLSAIVNAMTAAGLEVEHVLDPSAGLNPFSVAKVVEAVQHPNADRLRVCQVDTVDGPKEIVCGAPNARAGLTTIYAPLGAYVPGSGITLEARPVRGVVSNGMLCSAKELEVAGESDGILELDGALPVGTPAAEVFDADPVIDFEVTPNRPDWLGVAGVARDLSAVGLGALKVQPVEPVAGQFPCSIKVVLEDREACPLFAGRLIRGVTNGPSPEWLQTRLRAIGLRPINALVDVTNFLSYDRDRPLHVYDAGRIAGDTLTVRLAKHGEQMAALDGRTYAMTSEMTVIADESGVIDLGGVMGGVSTSVSASTTEVFLEAAWFDPIRTAQTGRELSLFSDAQYRFARGVDPGFVVPGLELATRMILQLCGGEPSTPVLEGDLPPALQPMDFDPAQVEALTGLQVAPARIAEILERLGFQVERGPVFRVQAPSWRRDVDGAADLVEEIARIVGLAALPSTPLPHAVPPVGGVATPRQARVRAARQALAAAGYAETIGWSFTSRTLARLFGGGGDALVLANPIASELDCMRPSALPGLIQAVGRNGARGLADCALFEVGPVFADDTPKGQRTAVAAVLVPQAARHWSEGGKEDAFTLKGELMAVLEELGAPVGSLQVVQGSAAKWWHPGRSARVQLGPKTVLAEFGALHPRVLKALDVTGPVYGFELWLEALPESKRVGSRGRSALDLSPLMPLSRDFAFLVDGARPAGDLVRAASGADKALIADVYVFDVYEGAGVAEGAKSVALEVTIQPREKTLSDAEIETLSGKVVAAVEKATGGKLRA
ncbi:phenylalanine--tRNA ligase subunit beta [Caulobacter sp. S45]|uniref:phenylalanine--tRNA ligase subunit beta n=1 Tax=Caulobacter sp. S45 TaxID=1641861 RepID=UPI0015773DAD|nr:phenylalanine--tRNA ligase subunit beta [Caulobacter sp. S45]